MPSSNAERQQRWRGKHRAAFAALQAENASLRSQLAAREAAQIDPQTKARDRQIKALKTRVRNLTAERNWAEGRKPKMRVVPTEVYEPEPGELSAQDYWQQGCMNVAGQSIALTASWDRQFGQGWRKFEVTSQMLTLAAQAADAWKKLLADFNARKGQRRDE